MTILPFVITAIQEYRVNTGAVCPLQYLLSMQLIIQYVLQSC